MENKTRNYIIGGGVAAGTSTLAMAQDSGATQDAISFPIDLASLATEIASAGALVLVTAFAVGIGFVMVKKLKSRLTRSV